MINFATLPQRLNQEISQKFSLYPHQAAVSIIISPEQEILFIKRSHNPKDPWSGHMAFPGGKKDHSDHDIIHTSRREIYEEVGISLNHQDHYCGSLSFYPVTYKQKDTGLAISPHIYLLPKKVELALDQTEVEDAYWISTDYLIDKQNRVLKEFSIQEKLIKRESIPYRGEFIWGITFEILNNFFQIFSGDENK